MAAGWHLSYGGEMRLCLLLCLGLTVSVLRGQIEVGNLEAAMLPSEFGAQDRRVESSMVLWQDAQWRLAPLPRGGRQFTLEDGGLVHAFASRKHPSAAAPVLKVKTQ